ncbi:hypothetical protein [Burkholderia seminalis]|uniref:hypothetical protein n=1 Tax=Burkholderia seminalis TaxID=488731 RepID=UPI000F59B812|nr:hypothetical protein [Burkholderia seminalis]RQS79760.1 hypothetical protein DF032_14405 [Burkholderia seminalis]
MNKPRNAIAGQPIDTEPDEERRDAFVAAYFETGKQNESAAIAGVHRITAQKWVKAAWFEKALRQLRRDRDKGLDARITKILDRSLEELEDRIENGDRKVVTVGRGEHAHIEVENVPVPARDLAVITGVLFDKRAALRKAPDEDENPEMSALERIADKLREAAIQQKAMRNDEAVDVEAHEVAGGAPADDVSDLV